MNATFTRRWIVREQLGSNVVRNTDDAIEVCGPVTRTLETIEARDRTEAERLAAEKHPGLKLEIIRAK